MQVLTTDQIIITMSPPGRLVSVSPVSGAPGPGSELSARAAWLRPVARQPRLARPGRAEAGGRGQVTS